MRWTDRSLGESDRQHSEEGRQHSEVDRQHSEVDWQKPRWVRQHSEVDRQHSEVDWQKPRWVRQHSEVDRQKPRWVRWTTQDGQYWPLKQSCPLLASTTPMSLRLHGENLYRRKNKIKNIHIFISTHTNKNITLLQAVLIFHARGTHCRRPDWHQTLSLLWDMVWQPWQNGSRTHTQQLNA